MNLQLPSIGKQIGLLLFVISFSIISVFAIVNSPKASDYISITQSTSAKETYKTLWHKVDSLTNLGQAKSALGVIDVIYKKAKVENNSPQFLKAILNQMSRKKQFEENHNVKSISYIKKEIRYSRGSQKAILQSILAELYYNYYTNNRWRINRRTETINFKKTDIETWTTKDLIDAAIKNYKLSLKDVKTLQKISLNKYSIILENKNGSKKYRPTLYDFLANRAIDFFRNSISGIIRPAEQFTMNNKDFFLPAKEFTELEIETSDSMSLDFYAINIFQELLKVHAKDKDPSALIDADLNRFQYVKDRTTIEFSDSLYFKGLNNLYSKYKEYSAVTNVAFIMAKHYNSMGAKYNRLAGDKYKWDKKKAVEYCENAIKKFPNSFGAKNCKLLIKDIKTKNLTISNEYANIPNKLSRALISYKNVPVIYFRIVRVDYSKYYSPNKRHGTKILTDKFLRLKPIKEWSVQLEDDGDFQKHAVEVKLPELELGFYIILLSYEPSFNNKGNQVIMSNVWMTNISYISKNSLNNNLDVDILHRQSGKSLSGVKVDCYINKYISSKNRRVYTHIGKYISDKNGFVKIQAPNGNYQNVFLEFEHNDDEFIPQRNHYIYPFSNTQTRSNTLCHIFTDRAIYRPGQKVYFKAIMLEKTGNNSKILSNYRTEIILLDRNSKAVEKLLLTTNEYGSISGEFTVPKGGLTGRMYISNTFGRQQITVEEYKRPKFELNFKAITGTYKLGEKINITGIAKAYAGNNIDGAKVKYRVVRTARFPYWSYWWRMPRPSSSSVEIENGEMLTDENGEFEISFLAMPDKSVSKSTKPVFNYVIYADVTDMNGETRSSQKTVSVSYTALMLSINIPKIIDVSKNHEFKITTNNFSGQHENTKGEIKIYKLKEPKRVFRNRSWQQADRFLMTKQEYYTNFPNDVYKDENKIYNWPMKKWGYTFSFDSSIDKKFDIKDILNNSAGSYMIEISATDKYGQVVSNKYFVSTFIANSKNAPNYSPHFFFARNKNAEPGDSVSFVIASKYKNLNILYEIESKDGTVHKEWINLSNEQKVFTIPVTEEFRGNFAYHISYIKNNRSYFNKQIIRVPFSNKKLDIEFSTFRNKLLPGQKEEWTLKIKGHKGEHIAAEMLAAMYDASLDAFKANNWYFNLYSSNYFRTSYQSQAFSVSSGQLPYSYRGYIRYKYIQYDKLNWFSYNPRYLKYSMHNTVIEIVDDDLEIEDEIEEVQVMEYSVPLIDKDEAEGIMRELPASNNWNGQGKKLATISVADKKKLNNKENTSSSMENIKIRTNFNETAFFYPQLKTDEEGNIIIKFTAPESLTKWKFMGLAHTKDLKYGQIREEMVTQKDLMIIPNAPRFFREGDKIIFTAKISNISEQDLEGEAKLMLFDALNMQPIDIELGNKANVTYFKCEQGKSDLVSWKLSIPKGIGAITYRVTALSGNFSDGEEMAVPVLSNRMLVTESMPLPINGNQTKQFKFTKLINSDTSSTLQNHKLTIEYTSNPAWYAIQALPYLMEYPYECSEQVFSRYYANSIASHIVNSSPKIKTVFDSWKNETPDALLSNLEKNQELKSLLLEETPWVLEAEDESARKQKIALLFDLSRMAAELSSAEQKLLKTQHASGAWPWFRGGYDSRYITQHIVTGFGHLNHLGIKDIKENHKIWRMIVKAVKYLDNQLQKDYEYLLKYNSKNIDKQQISNYHIQYLYARSYFKDDIKISNKNKQAFDYYFGQAKKYWVIQGKYMQGMLALGLHRYGEKQIPNLIIKSLKEHSLSSEEMGMYWKTTSGWYWYQAPIETQALLIEAFDEVANDQESVEEMKAWLLKQKQTQDWKTTKATADACYALLLKGSDLLSSNKLVQVKLDDKVIDPNTDKSIKTEAGTGYYKTSWSGDDVKSNMGNITVTKSDSGIAWGAIYWQYFENLDKITTHKTPLQLKKKLFIVKNTSSGPVLDPINAETVLNIGDKVKVRIELRVDRNMEYVHMKDMRASAFEPTNVISTYKWQDGLGYYQSTRDAATNFFFAKLHKGTYVFEYTMFVTHSGSFSNGITTIQSMYAPEFSSHSEGVRVEVR